MPTVNRNASRLAEARTTMPTTVGEAMRIAEIKRSSIPHGAFGLWDDFDRILDWPRYKKERFILARCVYWGVNIDRITLPMGP